MHLYGRNGSKTDTIFVHLRCGGIYSDSVINFSPILTVEEFWKSVNNWLSYKAYRNGTISDAPCNLFRPR